jgi:hypothetical protein
MLKVKYELQRSASGLVNDMLNCFHGISVKIPYLFEVFCIKKFLFTMIPSHSGSVKDVELATCVQNDKVIRTKAAGGRRNLEPTAHPAGEQSGPPRQQKIAAEGRT